MRSIVMSALALASVAVMAHAQAAPGQPGKVAVVTLQGAIVGTQDGKKALGELETKFGPKEKQIQQQKGEIDQLQEQMRKGSNTMAEPARAQLQRDIDDKSRRLNRDLQDAREEYEQENQRLVQSVAQRMVAVIEKYAKEHGYSMVLDRSNQNTPILYAATGVDITADVVALYNQSAPAAAAPTGTAPSTGAPSTVKPAVKPATPTRPATPPPAAK